MADKAHKWTDRKIKQLERRINKEYAQAVEEIEEKSRDYFRRFAIKDNKWRSWVKQGVKTDKEYQAWRMGQIIAGERWEELKRNLAKEYHNANDIAKKIAFDTAKDVYAENFNYSTYEIEHGLSIDTGFTLYDHETVERILRDDPSLLPEPGKKVSSLIAAGLDERWNRQIIQSVAIQGILQGESVSKIATRLAESVGDRNRKAAIRNARTLITGAQNAGREESYKRAQRMGIELKQQWIATHDERTRHEHRLLDGQIRNIGEPFEVEGLTIRFPGDPTAAPRMIYNCRCTLISQIKGFEIDSNQYRQDNAFGGMTYEEWKKAKPKSNPITLPEEKARNIKMKYVNEYRYN